MSVTAVNIACFSIYACDFARVGLKSNNNKNNVFLEYWVGG